jgi:hypothetical protein
MNQFYFGKASIPRRVKAATSLREALGLWGTDRLLHVANSCESATDDSYRFEYGRIHKRYANFSFLISEAIAHNVVEYTAETLLLWMKEDFDAAASGAQKDAAGICGAELALIIDNFGKPA